MDEVSAMTEVVEDPEGELKGKENLHLVGIDNSTSTEEGEKEWGNTAIINDNEGYCGDEMEVLEGVLSKEESSHGSGPPSLYCETVRTNGSCSKERNDDSSWDSDDESRDGQS